MLSENETQRYARQTLLPEIGISGQMRLKAARVLIIGAGGLGNPCAIYLAAAGIGTIGLIDDDVVSVSNLQRQILFSTTAVGESKAALVRERLLSLNPEIEVQAHDERLTTKNARALFLNYDWIVDATDNFAARALVSRFCLETRRTHIFAGISKFEGQIAAFAHDRGPCYRCLVPSLPGPGEVPNCAESGVVGAVAGVVGSLQALTVIKLILNDESVTFGELTIFNGGLQLLTSHSRAPSLQSFRLNERPDCAHHAVRLEGEISPHALENPLSHERDGRDDRIERNELLARDEWAANRFWPVKPIWVDVRNSDEYGDETNGTPNDETSDTSLDVTQILPLARALKIPLASLPARLNEFLSSNNYIVFCQSGVRSQKAQEILHKNGFQNVWNLRGGLNSNDLSKITAPQIQTQGAL